MGILNESWGSCRVVTRGNVHQADKLPGFVAEIAGKKIGTLTLNISQNMLEIVTLNVIQQREGVGRALVDAAIQEADSFQCSRVWVITTNDNTHAMEFYQALGFRIVAINKDAVDESRKLKPEIPLVGINGVPIKDEIELEKIL